MATSREEISLRVVPTETTRQTGQIELTVPTTIPTGQTGEAGQSGQTGEAGQTGQDQIPKKCKVGRYNYEE